MQTKIKTFGQLAVTALYQMHADLAKLTDQRAVSAMRVAILWVNTALDAYVCADYTSAYQHVATARGWIKTAEHEQGFSLDHANALAA